MKLRLKKGLDLRLSGAVIDVRDAKVETAECAVSPEDYPGFQPKLMVKEGDYVSVGSALMHDKTRPALCLVSPVSGTVKSIVRGERRRILSVIITNDNKKTHEKFDTRTSMPELLGRSGLLAELRRRPFDVVVRPEVRPRDIFVTGMDTAPLALPPTAQFGPDALEALKQGVKALHTLTDGKVYLCVDPHWSYGLVPGVEQVVVEGPHPAGNVGVQIANIAPVNRGEEVWTLDADTLYRIGHLMLTGQVASEVKVAVTGPMVHTPCVVSTLQGASMKSVVEHVVSADSGRHLRVISGNVLTGTAVSAEEGFLRRPHRQVTVIAEGDDVDEFMGWASLSPKKMSISRALPLSRLRRVFSPDARILGGRRAMIMSGEYDKVLPMDILPEYLLKAIIGRNIEDMEALGIYEIAPEDMALCEFVDTSKLPIQQIVRQGLDYLRKEVE